MNFIYDNVDMITFGYNKNPPEGGLLFDFPCKLLDPFPLFVRCLHAPHRPLLALGELRPAGTGADAAALCFH